MQLPDNVKRKLRELPDKPGCYLMRDRRGQIIYVGKAASLRKRVGSYFRAATLRSAAPKLWSLIHSVADLEILLTRSEAEALLTEGRLIKDYRPRYNTAFKDDKRFLLIRLDLREPYPLLKAVRLQRADGAHYFGPYASSAAARAAIEFTEKKFGLRRCRPRVPGPENHRHCIDDIVRYCAAPCTGRVTAEEYRRRAAAAAAFLRGETPGVLQELRTAMEDAARDLEFEKAAALRDLLRLLERATRERARMAGTPERERAEGLAGAAALQAALSLPRAPRTIEGFDVSNISGTLAVGSMVCAIDGVPQRARYRRFRIRTVAGSDDPAMLSEVVRRRFRRLQSERGTLPDLVLVDGGLTQVRAAEGALTELNLPQVAVAGLAKRMEEVYCGTGNQPVRLPPASPALRVLQWLRDEAHRFALGYHLRLRARRIRESVLDEIEGVGARRKERLLRHFGSVARLGRAAPPDIATVAGVSPAVAELIRAAARGGSAAGMT